MTGNPDCPHCHGVAPSTDGKTECGWCGPDHVPPVVAFDYDQLFDLIWDGLDDGHTDGEEATSLDESLWTEDGEHPWDGLFYGYEMKTYQTWAQTLEEPAEYESVGSLWITDADGKQLAELDVREYQ